LVQHRTAAFEQSAWRGTQAAAAASLLSAAHPDLVSLLLLPLLLLPLLLLAQGQPQ
jgi:hypothetical protein